MFYWAVYETIMTRYKLTICIPCSTLSFILKFSVWMMRPDAVFSLCFLSDHTSSISIMRLVLKYLDKMRCFRKRSTIPFLVALITFLLFINLYMEDGYVLVSLFTC